MSDGATAVASSPDGRDLKPWIAPVAIVLALVIGLGAIVLLSRRAAAPDAPPEAPAYTAPAKSSPMQAYDVQSVSGTTIRVAAGADTSTGAVTKDLETTATTRFETLQPIANGDVAVGDWLQIIGVPNQVKAFAIRTVIVTAGGGTPDAEGFVRSPGGFVGFEATQDANERPVLAGRVTAISSREGTTETAQGLKPVTYTVLTLEGPSGVFTVDLQDGANVPIREIVARTREDVTDGDRLAYAAGDGPVAAVLVLPGGAQ